MVIHRNHLAGLVLFIVATATAGCGSDSSSGDSPSQEPDPTELAVASVVKKMSNDSNDEFGFSAGQTECVAKGLVDQVGIKALQQYGFLDEKLKPGSAFTKLPSLGVPLACMVRPPTLIASKPIEPEPSRPESSCAPRLLVGAH